MPKPKNIPKKRVLEYLASLNNEDEANSSISAASSPNARATRTRAGIPKDQNKDENEGTEMQDIDNTVSQSDDKIKATRSGSLRGRKKEKELIEEGNDKVEQIEKPTRGVRKSRSIYKNEPIVDLPTTGDRSNLIIDGEIAGPSSAFNENVEVDKRSRGSRKRKSMSYKIDHGDDDSLCAFSDLEDEDDDKPYVPEVKKLIDKLEEEEEESNSMKYVKIQKRKSPVKRKSIGKLNAIGKSSHSEEEQTENLNQNFVSNSETDESNNSKQNKKKPRKSPVKRKSIGKLNEIGKSSQSEEEQIENLNQNFVSNSETVESKNSKQSSKKPRKSRKKSPAKKFEHFNEDLTSKNEGDASISCNKIDNGVENATNNDPLFDSIKSQNINRNGEIDGTLISHDGEEPNNSRKNPVETNNEYLNAEEMAILSNLMGSHKEITSENTNTSLDISGIANEVINTESNTNHKPAKKKGRPFGSKNRPKTNSDGEVIPGITKRKYAKRSLAPKKKVPKVKDDANGTDFKKEPGEKKTKGRKRKVEDDDPLSSQYNHFGKKRIRKKKGRKQRIGAPNKASDLRLPGTYDREAEQDEETEEEDHDKGGLVKRRKRRKHGEPYSVTGNWYIALGYLQDLNSLLKAWDKQQGMRYRDFAQCWRDKKFTLIYRGRQNFKELLEFSEELALLTKKFIVPPHTKKWRIGALFTLYALFYKHPMRHFFKIRLTLEEYKLVSDLVSPYRCDKDNPDPAYIFRKLEVEGAFFMTASSLEMCLDFHSAERESVNADYEAQRLAKTSSVTYALTSESLLEDDELMQHYARIKQNSVGEVLHSAVNMVDVNMATVIQDRMNELKQDSLVCLGLNEGAKEGSKHGISIKDALSIAQRRNIVRTKAMALNPKKVRGGLTACPEPSETPQTIKKKIQTDEMNIIEKKSGLISVSKTSKARAEILTDKTISSFMRPPSPVTLNKGLKKMGSQQPKVVAPCVDVTQTEIEIGTTGSTGVVATKIELEVNNQQEDENTNPDDVEPDDPPDDPSDLYSSHLDDDWMSMPPPAPPPKRARGRARKAVLMEAIKESQAAKPYITESKRSMDDFKHLFTGDDKTQLAQDLPSAVTINQRQIIDLPSDQTVMIPIKNEPIIGASNVALPGDNTIPINVIVEGQGRRITRKLLVKINYKQWEQIKSNEKRLNDLKGKLLPVVLRNLKFNNPINESEWKVVDCYVQKPLNLEIAPAVTPGDKVKTKVPDQTRNTHSFNGTTNAISGIQRKAKVIMKTIKVGDTIRHVPSYVTNEGLNNEENEQPKITVESSDKPGSLGLSEFDPVGAPNIEFFSTHSPLKPHSMSRVIKGSPISLKGINKKNTNIVMFKDEDVFGYFNFEKQKLMDQNESTNMSSLPVPNPPNNPLSSGQVVLQDWQPPPPGPTSMELLKEWGEEECREEPSKDDQHSKNSGERQNESPEEGNAEDSRENDPVLNFEDKDKDKHSQEMEGNNIEDCYLNKENDQSVISSNANEVDQRSAEKLALENSPGNMSPNAEEFDNHSDAGFENDFDISDSDEENEKDMENKEFPVQETEPVKRSPLSISIKKSCGVWEVKDPSPKAENNSKDSNAGIFETSSRKKREIKFSVPFGENSNKDNDKEKEGTVSSPLRRSQRSSPRAGNPKSNEILGLSNSDVRSPRKRLKFSEGIEEISKISNQNKIEDNPSNLNVANQRVTSRRGQRARGRGARGQGRGQKMGHIAQQNIEDDTSDAYTDDFHQQDSSEDDVPDIPKKIDVHKTDVVPDVSTTQQYIEDKPRDVSLDVSGNVALEANTIEDQEKFMEVFGLVSPHKSHKKKLSSDGRITPAVSANLEDPLGLNNPSDVEDSANVKKILKDKLCSKDAARILTTNEISITPEVTRNVIASSGHPLMQTPILPINTRNHPIGADALRIRSTEELSITPIVSRNLVTASNLPLTSTPILPHVLPPGLVPIPEGPINQLIVPQNPVGTDGSINQLIVPQNSGGTLHGQKPEGIIPLLPGQPGTIRHVKDAHGNKTAYYLPAPQFVPRANLLGAQMRPRMVQPVNTKPLEQIGSDRLPLPPPLSVNPLIRSTSHRPPLMPPMSVINPSSYRDIQQRTLQHSAIMSTVNERPIQSATIASRHPNMMMAAQPVTVRDPSTMMPPPGTLSLDTSSPIDRRSTPRADRFNPSTPQDVARMARVNDPKGTKLVKLRIDNETIWVPARNVVINPDHIKQEESTPTTQTSSNSTGSRDLLLPPDHMKKDPVSPEKANEDSNYSDVASRLPPGTLISNTQIKELEKNRPASDNVNNNPETKSATSNASRNITPITHFDPETQTTTVNITIEQMNSLMKSKIDEKLKEQVGSMMTQQEISTPKMQKTTQKSTMFSPQSSTSNPINQSTPKPRGGVCSFTFGKKPPKPVKPSTPTTPVSTVTKPKPKTPVCSFLFGPKYKMMSKLKETIGEATGKAAKPSPPVKKRNVSFLLMKPLSKKKI